MGVRDGSEDFETYFVLATIHSEKFRHYVFPHIRADYLNFWLPRTIYEACLRLHNRDRRVSFISVIEEVKKDISISDEKVLEICEFLNGKSKKEINLPSVIDSVIPRVEQEIGRNVLTQAIIMSQSYLEDGKFDSIFKTFEKAKAQTIYQQPKELDLWKSIGEEESEMQWRPGIKFGVYGKVDDTTFEYLDDRLFYKGASRGSLTIFGGGGKMGKTTFLQNIAISQSLNKYNVDFYSLENDLDYLKARSLSIITNIPTNNLRDPEVFKKAKMKIDSIQAKYPQMGNLHYYHYQAHSLTPSIIAHNINFNESIGRKVDCIIIDYVDIMSSERHFKEDWQRAAYNTLACRDLGIENDCAIITASQLDKESFNKKTATRKNIRGAYSKIFTCDIFATLSWETTNCKDAFKDKKQVKHVNLYLDASRFGDGDITMKLMEADMATGRFFNIFGMFEKE